MATATITALTFRIEPGWNETLRTAADREHRSIANKGEVPTRNYCGRYRVMISKKGELSSGGE